MMGFLLFVGPRDGRGASLVAQRLKHLPAMQETQVRSLGWEDPLEKEMATHSSILGLENPMDREAWWATVHGVAKSRTRLSNFTYLEMEEVPSFLLLLPVNPPNLLFKQTNKYIFVSHVVRFYLPYTCLQSFTLLNPFLLLLKDFTNTLLLTLFLLRK